MTLLRDISFLWSMFHVVAFLLLLFKPRCSWRTTLILSFAVVVTLLCTNVLLMYWLGHGIIMSAAFFTCTLPSLLMFFLLSEYRDGRFFFLFCLSDTMSFWLMQLTNLLDRMAGETYVVLLISRLLLFPLAEYFLWRYLRRPFLELQRKLSKGWWLFAAMGGVYYLLIMFTAIPVDAPMPDAAGLGTICLVMILMPLTYITIFNALWRQMRIYENTRQMELQHRDYESIRQKMELGRIYRHDMRHHLAALDSMLQQEDSAGARQYVQALTGGLDDVSNSVSCANPAVNAVLSAYLSQAANANCPVETKLNLPEELPFDDTDLCILLANPLENAIHACQKLPEDQRKIHLGIELTDNRRLIVSIANPCPQPVEFGPDGLPAVKHQENHGLGLQSVRAVADKYGGLFRCQWEDGAFQLRAVLIPPAPDKKKPGVSRVSAAIFGMLLFLILLNCLPALATALEEIPILGSIIRVVDLRTYTLLWKNSEMSVQQPQISGEDLSPDVSDGVAEANQEIQDFIDQMEEKFRWYADRRYEGHAGADISYTILRDDPALLVLRFDAVINVGGSVNYCRHFSLDKSTGNILSLSDLFLPDSRYVPQLSREVRAQMEEALAAGTAMYFLPSAGWPEEDCFQSIDPDQDYYINGDGDLVLVFEEYSVAPGSMGTPEFVIPSQLIAGILARPLPVSPPAPPEAGPATPSP